MFIPYMEEDFICVATKIVVRLKEKKMDFMTLGSLESYKDWGYAKDYVYAMWVMAKQNEPDDYILATGKSHSVREFVEAAFEAAGIQDWKKFVKYDEHIVPRTDALLVGNSEKACRQLFWKPSISFRELAALLVRAAQTNHFD